MNPDEIGPDEFDDLVRDALDQLPDEAGHALGLGEAQLRAYGWY